MTPSLVALLLFSCQPAEEGLEISRLRSHGAGVAGITLSLRSDDDSDSESSEVTVETRQGGGEWEDAATTLTGGDRLDVALVADNSGSETGFLGTMQAALGDFGAALLATSDESRVGLVRVATESRVVQDLTGDAASWDAAVDALFIANGWTALWDGVRIGNEVLDAGAEVTTSGGLEVCLSQAQRSVVVFTDGQENNSADEHATSYDGDGIDTTLSEIIDMSVLGIGTPVHVIGIGHEVDEDQLTVLSDGSGGHYQAIDDVDALSAALVATVDELADEIPVCFEASSCEHDEARITVTRGAESWEVIVSLPDLCEDGDTGDGGDGDDTADESCQTIDFDVAADGSAVEAGQDLSTLWSAMGVTLSADDDRWPIAFDSSEPSGGDYDLGTPNSIHGGPGVGRGGVNNTESLGMVMIVPENLRDSDGDGLVDDPDDDAAGGKLTLTFDGPSADGTACLTGLDLLDIDGAEDAVVTAFDPDGVELDRAVADPLGDNSWQRLELELCGVGSVEIDLSSSGGIDNIGICAD